MTVVSLPVGTFSAAGRDVVGARAGSAARLGAAFLLMPFVLSETVFHRGANEQFRFNWELAVRLAVCGACGFYGFVHLRKSLSTLLSGPGLVAIAFASWAGLTALFGVNPTYSVGTVVCLWCAILFAAALITEVDPSLILKTVVVSLLALLIATWIVHFLLPNISEDMMFDRSEDRLAGLEPPDTVGCWGAMTVTLLLVLGIQRLARWRTLAVPLAFAALTVILTVARGSMFATAAVVVVAALRSMRPAKAVAFVLVFVPLAAAVIAFPILAGGMETGSAATKLSRSGDVDEVYSMTGRTNIWESVVRQIDKSPLAGYGYGSSRFMMEPDGPFEVFHAHNQLLNVMLETGIIGGGLFLLQIVVLGLRSFTARDPFSELILILVLVNGFTLRVMMPPVPDSLTLLWFLALLSPLRPTQPSDRFSRLTLLSAETA